MRLISLTANKDTFHPLKFREKGVSYIVARQKNPEQSDKGKTTNGVGKSLIVTLIHFCLGSNENEKLAKAIPDWEFTLTFEIEGVRHSAIRNLKKQDQIKLDGVEMNLTKYRDFLETNSFDIPQNIGGLSFRSLIKRFVRPSKESYNLFDSVASVEPPFARLLNMSLLLGVDVGLVHEKHRLKKDKDRVEAYLLNLEKDTIFKNFFTKDKDVDSELLDLDEKIKKFEEDLGKFQVAEDYHEIEAKANDARRRLQLASNQTIIVQNTIEHIQASLKITPDLSADRIEKLYAEVGIVFPESVKHTLGSVMKFHSDLIKNRVIRLEGELQKLVAQMKRIDQERSNFGEELDGHLKYLGAHSALEVFLNLSKVLSDCKSQASRLREYKKLLETYRNEIQNLKVALAQETIKAETFLQNNAALITANTAVFRGFAKKFYPDVPSGLSVVNNDGDNQIRFEIVAKIQSDGSDGINEVKIFCFDMTLLKLGFRNRVRFIFHDSRLFSDVDARQLASLFKIVSEETETNDLQYIATVNEDQIKSVEPYYTAEELKMIINDNVIHTLTDENAAAKLLGIQVDID